MNNETIEFEGRSYVNPEISMAEQDQFIEKFRDIQAQNQAQIDRDTYNLGTPVSSNLGGLTGAEGLWNAQYQRPQVDSAIANLRQINLQQAVNTAMQNQQSAIQNRINQAKRAYYRAQQEAYARDRANTNSGNGDGSKQGSIDLTELPEGKISSEDTTIRSNAPGTSTVLTPGGVTNMGQGKPDVGVYDDNGRSPLWSSNEEMNSNDSKDTSFWDVNNPLGWLSWVLGLAGSKQQVKK